MNGNPAASRQRIVSSRYRGERPPNQGKTPCRAADADRDDPRLHPAAPGMFGFYTADMPVGTQARGAMSP